MTQSNPPTTPQSTPSDVINIAQQATVSVPSKEALSHCPIRVIDWRRLRRLVKNMPSDTQIWLNSGFCFAGLAFSFWIGYVTLYTVTTPPPWMFPFFLISAIAGTLLATLSFVANVLWRSKIKNHLQIITDDLDDIEKTFPKA
jgi:hypothetical protein